MIKCDRDYYPYFVDIPDFHCAIHSKDPFHAIQDSRKRIAEEIISRQNEGKDIPRSNHVIPTMNSADVVTLVDVDTEQFVNARKPNRIFSFLR